MFNVGYTINPAPKRRLVTAHINQIFMDHQTAYCTSYVQYEKMDDVDQKILLLWLLEELKKIFKHSEFGDFYYERTKAGNMHMHGYFVAPSPVLVVPDEIEALNKVFSSGNQFVCIKMTNTKKDKYFWNDKYILKDVDKIDLFTIPLDIDDSDFSEVV